MERGNSVCFKLRVKHIHRLIRALGAWKVLHEVEDAVKFSVLPLPDICYPSMFQQLIIKRELIKDVIYCRGEVISDITVELLRLQLIPMLF